MTNEELVDEVREAAGDLYGQGDVRFNGKPALKLAHEALDILLARLTTAETLLARVEPELIPHYDEAQRLSDKFGLGMLAKTTLITDIRAALACPPQQPGEVTTCLRCGRRSVVAHGGGFKCRDCGAACPPPEEEK